MKQHSTSKRSHIILTPLGVLTLMTTLFLILSIFSFDIHDPSLNNVNNNQTKNWCGKYGALVADPILQSVGLASVFVVMFLTTTGIRLILQRPFKLFVFRLTTLLLLLPLCATFFTNIQGSGDKLTYLPFEVIRGGGFIGIFVREELKLYISQEYIMQIAIASTVFCTLVSANMTLIEMWLSTVGLFKIACKAVRHTFLCSLRGIAYIKRRYISYRASHKRGHVEPSVTQDEQIEIQPAYFAIDNKKKPSQSSLKFDTGQFEIPPTSLLREAPTNHKRIQFSESALNQNSKLLQQVLQDFGIYGKIVTISPGPVVTLYELEPAAGTKSSRVIGLADDISRSMSALSARIATIPGKNALGIELPNTHRETVFLRELLESTTYTEASHNLPLVLGKSIGGEPIVVDLAKMPHLLVAGTTGSGKSVAINTMILSLLYKLSPEECRFIMIDPKMLELSVYEGIPHLLTPVVTDPKKAVVALKWVVKEMEQRYRSMSVLGVRNIGSFNKAIQDAKAKGEKLDKQIQVGFDQGSGKPIFESITMPDNPLPYIVVIVDEMADLMLVSGKDIEGYIQRLAQMARAAGIHLITATQRPSVDVITGVIKANFPTRISFQVTSKIDSRTILGEQGAEQLLGMGDMLYMAGGGKISRIHGPFVGDSEIETIVTFLKQQEAPKYQEDVTLDDEDENSSEGLYDSDGDDLYAQAVAIVIRDNRPTTSYIQRCLKIGYNKAASFIERMEKEGIVSSPNHTGKREILGDHAN
ncbi:DNA translocase FtsK [Rickettsiales endosymbiont of Peranema trichophorum]|uniref:FtsK/SpoIIIE family DNA translocase n=1 Tax=Rickettsiales endosymbiont of Peranema trichophorum TaxID=2486577 RepID=UPI001022E758|nr:DNA translocase FtsK 4TM domain-containing protein [Rickettsiales endosymbiont of Peranema trichophorum]RZI47528.1 DNA translocase FtsK [Rickettsiales endosymbiont of Peranema trichophorum]